jgi:hypothetical protein
MPTIPPTTSVSARRHAKNAARSVCVLALLAAGSLAAAPAGVPRTSDGRPDLQGYWDNSTLTPLERPKILADQEFFSDQDIADYESPAKFLERAQAKNGDEEALTSGEVNSVWRAPRRLGRDRRTSLIVDPPGGKLPELSPAARARMDRRASYQRRHVADNPEDLSLSERCLVWGADPPLLPIADNNLLQIVQTPDYVMILHEMMHDARIIPLDGRPHLSASMGRWTGDSRGRWDGDTLVIDTTNFTDKTAFQGSGSGLHIVERFSRTDAATLRYEFTVEDPTTFARAWTAALTMARTSGPLLEYACHEGNYSIVDILRGARAQDR